MNILGIEASVARGSVALQCGAQTIERVIDTPRSHAEQLIPCIGEVLAETGIVLGQLDAIAFGRGPGSFIGVRLATAVAQGLAAASGVGLAPISSMAALAARALCSENTADDRAAALDVVVCLDARMNEVYLAEYRVENGQAQVTDDEQLLGPDAVRLPAERSWVAAGNGFRAYPQLEAQALSRAARTVFDLEPRALELLPLARGAVTRQSLVAPEAWRSEYLRGQSAWRRQK